MPSPIAHSVAGLVVAHLALRSNSNLQSCGPGLAPSRRSRVLWAGALIFAANAADLDFLPGLFVGNVNLFHHKITHTLFAAMVFALLSAGFAFLAGLKPLRRIG